MLQNNHYLSIGNIYILKLSIIAFPLFSCWLNAGISQRLTNPFSPVSRHQYNLYQYCVEIKPHNAKGSPEALL